MKKTETFEEIQREHEDERGETARLIAEGIKTPREIHDENTFIPLDAKFEKIDFLAYALKHYDY